MAFSATVSRSFLESMSAFTGEMLNDAVERLASKYGFDKEEAKSFLMSGGIEIKLPSMERSKLPWCGMVEASCCKAIQKNGGLFTQCVNPKVDESMWCKKCTKDVEKNGTPSNGDVEARLAGDIMKYKIGKTEVKPYLDYMEKNGITREQAEEAAAEYGMTIDPRQFEKKKRGRKISNPAVMVPSVNVEPEMAELTTEELSVTPTPVAPVPAVVPVVPVVQAVVQAAESSEEESEEVQAAEESDEESDEEVEDDTPLTLKLIKDMKKEEVMKTCAKYNIETANKTIIDLKKELKSKVT
jgi:hypothetical protein